MRYAKVENKTVRVISLHSFFGGTLRQCVDSPFWPSEKVRVLLFHRGKLYIKSITGHQQAMPFMSPRTVPIWLVFQKAVRPNQ